MYGNPRKVDLLAEAMGIRLGKDVTDTISLLHVNTDVVTKGFTAFQNLFDSIISFFSKFENQPIDHYLEDEQEDEAEQMMQHAYGSFLLDD